jgi:hypothetical protein
MLRRSIGGEFDRDVGETVNGCLSVGWERRGRFAHARFSHLWPGPEGDAISLMMLDVEWLMYRLLTDWTVERGSLCPVWG